MSLFIDPNNVDFRNSWNPVGNVQISHSGNSLRVKGRVEGPVEGNALIIVDAARRFVFAENTTSVDFDMKLPDCLSSKTWPLSVYLYNDALNVAYPLGDLVSPAPEKSAPTVPSFKDRYVQEIVTAMRHEYTSISSKDGIKTGNGYQSVDLDLIATQGGRPHRNLFLDHVDFAGKTALDIGANTGEMSRLARKRGAALVDGYEYDPLFVETGRMINAATGMTRVSLFQGDATDRALYEGMKYDIVMTFAVWVYTAHLLDKIADIADVVVFETHTLDHGLEMYTKPMSKYFPYFRVVGYDEKRDMRKSRCFMVFAKTAARLARTLKLHQVTTDMYFDHDYFTRHGKTTVEAFAGHAADVAKKVTDKKPTIQGLGTSYFELFMAGYHEFSTTGNLTAGNVFAHEFRQAIKEGRLDQNLKYLVDDEFLLLQKIEHKYQDITNILSGNGHLVAPPTIRPGEGALTFKKLSGESFSALNIDGHHRVFMQQLLGIPAMEVLMREPLMEQKTVVSTNYKIG
ncbi:class I SAM-dependent methyltransferase [Shinella zoogloeoides]|uniref:class I SAM-dependent methyltransferase n=1 Tax=Shinella zoogloeoides TaxID=352475 RepID=UPI00273DC6B9|nr:class I SAM-dependent methyltransferase [Shinella zoogloeoides]WLR92954.1 class I SAM-dependent methyltransferase [Shinella zoogloeoides]